MWQSKVPLPKASFGRSTCERIMVTTGGPNVMFGTKCPSIMSTCSQSAPCSMVYEHALPRAPKSALRIEGAMIAAGAIVEFAVAEGRRKCVSLEALSSNVNYQELLLERERLSRDYSHKLIASTKLLIARSSWRDTRRHHGPAKDEVARISRAIIVFTLRPTTSFFPALHFGKLHLVLAAAAWTILLYDRLRTAGRCLYVAAPWMLVSLAPT